MAKKPVIGITLDWEDIGGYSSMYPWYALRCNYAEVISNNGGIPLILPYDFQAIEKYKELIDGLLIPGGDYDLDPIIYGEEKAPETRTIRNNRSNFESALVKEILAQDKPILGICAGEQLLAAIHGGKLWQDIKTSHPDALPHEQKHLGIHMSKPSHIVSIEPGTLLHKIVKQDIIEVNSSHHQAVKSVGSKIIISGRAPDGIIEAIEMPEYSFVLGVEWHPEYVATPADSLIVQAFIEQASEHAK